MEGLIPLVYRRIKRSVSHRHYKCLSTSGGADFYVAEFDDGKYYQSPPLPEAHRASDVSDRGFRRSSSSRRAEEKTAAFGDEYLDPDPTRKRQLVRHRSHRGMFSCITG